MKIYKPLIKQVFDDHTSSLLDGCGQQLKVIILLSTMINDLRYGNTVCLVFKQGVQNWENFCLTINIPKGNNWILRVGLVGRCQKIWLSKSIFYVKYHPNQSWRCQKIWFSKSIFYFKNHSNLSHFFSLKNPILGAHFFGNNIFDNSILNHFITKMIPNFWQLPTTPILKIQ